MKNNKQEIIYGVIFSVVITLLFFIGIYWMTTAENWNVCHHDKYCEGANCKCHERGF